MKRNMTSNRSTSLKCTLICSGMFFVAGCTTAEIQTSTSKGVEFFEGWVKGDSQAGERSENPRQQVAKNRRTPTQPVSSTVFNPRTSGTIQQRCYGAPEPAVADDLSIVEYAKTKTINYTASQLFNGLDLSQYPQPKSIDNPCEADLRLSFVHRANSQSLRYLTETIQLAQQSLELDEELETNLYLRDGGNLNDLTQNDSVTIQRHIEHDLKLINKAIEEQKIANKETFSQMLGKFKMSAFYIGSIISVDHHIFKYTEKDTNWLINNLNGLGQMLEQGKSFKNTLSSLKYLYAAADAQQQTGLDTAVYKRTLKQQQQEINNSLNELELEL